MGLLDGNLDPQSLASLQLAAGLLSPGSFGQGLGRGLAGYQSTLAGAQEMQIKQQALEMQRLQFAAALRNQNLINDALNDGLHPQASAPSAPSAPSQPSIMAGAPGTTFSGAPTSAMNPNMVPQAQAAPQSGGVFGGVPREQWLTDLMFNGGKNISTLIKDYTAPTDLVRAMRAAGIDPNSEQGRQYALMGVTKLTNIPPVQARAGSTIIDGVTKKPLFYNPVLSHGGMPIYADDGQTVIGESAIPGAAGVAARMAAATEGGKGSMIPFTSGVTSTGAPAPVISRTQAATGKIAPETQAARDTEASQTVALTQPPGSMYAGPTGAVRAAQDLKEAQNAVLKAKTPGERAIMQAEVERIKTSAAAAQSQPEPGSNVLYGAAPLGMETTAKKSAEDAVQNYNEMHTFATASAPRNISLLQSIEQLADKTLVGPGASKIQFINGVLNTIGITPGADQAQNYQIMKKNLNMLVGAQRAGAPGGGSDAFQALLEAANPNVAEMNGPAAKEAAQELIAYNRMMMAKDKVMPNPMSTSPKEYQAAETKFAQFADPRLWQLEHASNDAERTRILSLMPPAERSSMIQKARAARQAGILN